MLVNSFFLNVYSVFFRFLRPALMGIFDRCFLPSLKSLGVRFLRGRSVWTNTTLVEVRRILSFFLEFHSFTTACSPRTGQTENFQALPVLRLSKCVCLLLLCCGLFGFVSMLTFCSLAAPSAQNVYFWMMI